MLRKHSLLISIVVALGFIAGRAEAGTLTNVSFTLSDYTAGANATITLSYTTATAIPTGGRIVLAAFQGEFVLAQGNCAANVAVTLNGAPMSPPPSSCHIAGISLEIFIAAPISAPTNVVITVGSAIARNPGTNGVKTMLRLQTSGLGVLDNAYTLPSVIIGIPTVTAISPTKGPVAGGAAVTITGTIFTGATAVQFGAVNATSFAVNSATSITATAPAASAGTVDVRVTTPGGTSAIGAADQYNFVSSGPVSVPALSDFGLLLLAIMLAAGGSLILRRKSILRPGA